MEEYNIMDIESEQNMDSIGGDDNTYDMPRIVCELQEEEQHGLFRIIAPQYAHDVNDYYRRLTSDRFEFINPSLECPGSRFNVVMKIGRDHKLIAHGYVRIVMTPHGWFVQIHPNQLVIPLCKMKSTRGTPLSTYCGWSSFTFNNTDIYYAGHISYNNDNATIKSNDRVLPIHTTTSTDLINNTHRGQTSMTNFVVCSPSISTPIKETPNVKSCVVSKCRKIKEFPVGFIYINLQNVFIVKRPT